MKMKNPMQIQEMPKVRRRAGAIRRTVAACTISFILAAGVLANAQSTNDAGATDFSDFRIIAERNIFDPNRYPRMSHHHVVSHRVPTFTLAGTMSYRKGMFAFFNGTADEYQKALQVGGTIAGYTVVKIAFDGVTLKSAGQDVEMKVGAAMQKEGDGWQLIAPGNWGGLAAENDAASNDTNSETASPSVPSGGADNDILKKLMQQREQELK